GRPAPARRPHAPGHAPRRLNPRPCTAPSPFVIAGLVPAIHLPRHRLDHRDKPGGDDGRGVGPVRGHRRLGISVGKTPRTPAHLPRPVPLSSLPGSVPAIHLPEAPHGPTEQIRW